MGKSQFQLLKFLVHKVDFNFNIEIMDDNNKPHPLNLQTKIERHINKENKREVLVTLHQDIVSSDNFVNIGISISGLFKASGDMTDDLFNRMCEVNAPTILYPFVRALIANLTAQSGIAPIMLPVMNFTVSPDNDNEKKIT